MFFPNPTEELFIYALTNGQKMTLEIYDRAGKIVYDEVLLDRVNSIVIEEFDAGVYIYRIMIDGKIYDQGRFIKL